MQNLDPTINVVAGLSATLSGFERIVGNPEVRRSAGFENRPLECNHAASFNLRLLKSLVQNPRGSAEEFENRLLGPTNPELCQRYPFKPEPGLNGPLLMNWAVIFCRESGARREILVNNLRIKD